MTAFQKDGSEFLVNTIWEGFQQTPSIAGLANGSFVATWKSTSVNAQVFNANGSPQGNEFAVPTIPTAYQSNPVVVGLSNGSFVISWEELSEIKVRLFNANGTAQGAEFDANNEQVDIQDEPVIAALDGGGFVVAWKTWDATQDGDDYAIKSRLFDGAGSPIGTEILVNSEALLHQEQPSVAGLSGGGYVVSWTTRDGTQDGHGTGIKGQVFSATGSPLGDEFLVNTGSYDGNVSMPGEPGYGQQINSDVVGLSNGNFVAVWETDTDSQDTSRTAIKGQMFDSSGSKIGGEFLVNNQTAEFQLHPSVTALPGGGFAVSWKTGDTNQDGDGQAVKAREFDGTGAPVGGEFLVNTASAGDQFEPVLTTLSDGRLAVAWTTNDASQDGDWFAIKAQVFVDPSLASVGLYTDDTFSNAIGTFGNFADALAAAAAGQAIDILDAPGVGDVGAQSVTVSGLTVRGDAPFDAQFSLVGGVTEFALQGSTTASVVALANPNDMSGSEGANLLEGGGGADTLVGNGGNDSILGGNGTDSLDGGAGADTLKGEGGNDTLDGGAGADRLDGGNNADVLSGGDGDDILVGQIGKDDLSGGAGHDTLLGGNANDTLKGGDGDDSLSGQGEADSLSGDSGNDTLLGGASADTLDGGSGNDLLNGGAFKDLLIGGTDNDTLLGGAREDTLDGGSGSDSLDGGSGNDVLGGGSGSDTLVGGIGSDAMSGDGGSDNLAGGNGNDTLDGGIGNDTMTGGSGADVFVFASNGGQDRITDFNDAADQIDVSDFGLASVADFVAQSSDVGGALVFASGGATLTVDGWTVAQVGADDLLL